MPTHSEIVARLADRHMESSRKPDDVVLPVTGVSSARGKTYDHAVFIRPSPYKKGQFIVVIDGTPGQWYVEDFLAGRGPLAIDYGQGWVLDNADVVRAAVSRTPASTSTPSAPNEVAQPSAAQKADDFVILAKLFAQAVSQDNKPRSMVRLREMVQALEPFAADLFGEPEAAALAALARRLR